MIRKYLLTGLLSASPAEMRETPGGERSVCRQGGNR
jgi:hypothetical protein